MPPAERLSIAQRLDAACDRFEADWQAGKSPRIEDALAPADGADADALFRALLAVELELRVKNRERVTSAEYKARFPDRVDAVIEVFRAMAEKRKPGSGDTSVIQESIKEEAATLAPRPKPVIIQPGQSQIGRFVLTELLGEGAFGQVFRARDPNLDRDVAIKTPRPGVINNEADRERFLREARALATVQHPNVCPVYEVGESDGRLYTVMAFVSGKTLAEAIKERKTPMPERQAALIVRKLALALEAAHVKGVIHRDLKPSNIMFDRERKDVVVMDFGLARRAAAIESELTLSGFVLGTPAYMAPEQAKGDIKSVGPCSDIYSLGVILYELLAGRRPFSGAAGEVIGKVQHVEPDPPSKWRADVDPKLEAICKKAMAKDPAQRYASMGQFAAALTDWLKSSPSREGEAPAEPLASGSAGASPSRSMSGESDESIGLQQVFAVLSDQRKQTVAAVEAAVKKFRPPLWMWLAGAGFAGLVATLGIIFFARTPTAMIMINVDVDLKDKSLSFVLDGKPISAEALANPIELKVGDHELAVFRGEKLEKWIKFSVKGGRNPEFNVQEVKVPEPPPSGYDRDQQAIIDRLKSIGARLTEVANDRGRALTGIYLAFNNQVDDKLVESFKLFPTLESVNLHSCSRITNQAVEHLRALPRLKQVGFSNTPITDKALEIFGGIHTIEDLDISSNSSFTEAGIAHLKALVNLRRIAVISSPISDNTAEHIGAMGSLQEVNLQGTTISDRGASYLGRLPQLIALNLAHTKISDESPKQLADLKTLQVLNLEVTGVTDKGVAELAKIETLRSLNVVGTRISPDALRQLRATLPNCDIAPKPQSGSAKLADGFVPLFNGSDLTGWRGLPRPWTVQDGAIYGKLPANRDKHTFLCSTKTYRDFELKFQVRMKDGKGNSGVQIRSNIIDPKEFIVAGPQVEIDAKFGGLWMERNANAWMQQAPDAVFQRVFKPAEFNAYFVRAVGKHITIAINGETLVDGDFPTMSDEGIIALQLHGRNKSDELVFKDVMIRELSTSVAQPSTSDGDLRVRRRQSGNASAPAKTPEQVRRAAEWVQQQGGGLELVLLDGDVQIELKHTDKLPDAAFRVDLIAMVNNSKPIDEGLSNLEGVAIHTVWLANTTVTDNGLKHVKGIRGLTGLTLDNTKITDSGLEHLAGSTQLVELHLDGTSVTDAGLAHLAKLKGLKKLTLTRTNVSTAGVSILQQALPGCHIGVSSSPPAPPVSADKLLNVNLIRNGDAEEGKGAMDIEGREPVPQWTTTGAFTALSYEASKGFPTSGHPGPPRRGKNFFAGGLSPEASAEQTIEFSTLASRIDSGSVRYTLSGFLGGFEDDTDQVTVTVEFLDGNRKPIQLASGKAATAQLGPITNKERANRTGLFERAAKGNVPRGARSAVVFIQCKRFGGNYDDAYCDNLSLIFR